MRVAIVDALSYNTADKSGGPNGSIQFEADRAEAKGTKEMVGRLLKCKVTTPLPPEPCTL